MTLSMMKLTRKFEPYSSTIQFFTIEIVSKNDPCFRLKVGFLSFRRVLSLIGEDVDEAYTPYLDHMFPILWPTLCASFSLGHSKARLLQF